jgi:hypothetical protein
MMTVVLKEMNDDVLIKIKDYHPTKDYIIDFDNVWKWCGCSRKDNAKTTLVNNFKLFHDYKILMGVRNKETILLNVRTFKEFCITVQTKKAAEIRKTFIIMEELYHESNRREFYRKCIEMEECETEMENNLILNADNKRVLYFGLVEEDVVKFGYSRGVRQRVKTHKTDFPRFKLKRVFETNYNMELEDAVKERFKDRRISKVYRGKNQTELIQLDSEFTVTVLNDEVLELLKEINDRKYEDIMKLKEEKEILLEENNNLKEYLRSRGIEKEYNHTNRLDTYRMKYLKEFLLKLYEENKGSTEWYSNKELYGIYKNDIVEKYDEMYVFDTNEKLTSILKSCMAIKLGVRRTLNRTDPHYKIGIDNRVKGKTIYFNDVFKAWLSQ